MSSVPPLPGNLRGAVDLTSLVNRRNTPPRAAAPAAGGAASGPASASASTGVIRTADDATFTEILELSSTVPVVVDLRAEWSEQSASMTTLLERVVSGYGGRLVLVGVEIEQSPQLAQAFQAQSVPTVAAVVAGRPVPLFAGLLGEDALRDLLDQLLELAAQNGVSGVVEGAAAAAESAEPVEEPLPPHHQEAYDAIDRGDYETAIAEYTTAIAQNPRDDLAVAGLAQVKLLDRLQGKTLEAVRASAAAAPDDLDPQLDVADLDISGGHVDDAFDRLLTLFPKLDAEGKSVIRTRVLELFEIVGQTDPRVIKARARLTGLLY